jgi:hypothetical protein
MAEPLRYRDLARPSLVDTNVVDTGEAGRLQALAGTFKAFETQAASIGGELAAQRGAGEGAAAGASGAPDLKSAVRAATSKYAAAYNNAATRSYLVNAEADLEDTAARLEQDAGTNAAAFEQSFGRVRQETLKTAPPALRGMLEEMYTKHQGAAMARIGAAAMKEQNDVARNDTQEGVARSVDRIANLRASDDVGQLLAAEEEDLKLSILIDSAVADGTISQLEGEVAHVNAQRAIVKQTVLARFKRELDNPYGNPLQFISRLREMNKTSEALPPDEEEKLGDALMAELRERNSLNAMGQEQARADRQQRYNDGNREATAALLEGSLTSSQLLKMVEDDLIDPDTARTLQNELTTGPREAKSDPKALLSAEVNLLELDEKDILTNPALSYADKSRLILKQREEVQGWRGSVPGREAVDRIDRALGLVPGSIMNATLSDIERTKRERAMTEFYNEVQALPPEEREAKAIAVAEQVIGKVIKETSQQKLNDLRARREAVLRAAAGKEFKGAAKKEFDDQMASLDKRIQQAEQAAK